jgi:hypothetical protein
MTVAERVAPATHEAGPLALPRLIHIVWPDGEPPAHVIEAAQTWEREHPGWGVLLWTGSSLPPLRNQAIHDALDAAEPRARLAGYELLHRYGGIAVEAGVECRRGLEPLLAGVHALLVATPEKTVAGAVMGSTPGHPFIGAVLASVATAIAARPQDDPADVLGDELLTEVLRGVANGDRSMAAHLGADDLPTGLRPHHFFPGAPVPDGELDDAVYAVLGSVAEPATAERHAVRRVVYALDGRAPAVLSMLLRSFCTLFGPDDPVEFAVCVPDDPGQEHASVITDLLRAIAPNPTAVPDVALYSYAEAVRLPFAAAVVAPSEQAAAGVEAADAIGVLTRVRAALDTGAALPPTRPGAQLRRRLTR